MKPAQHSEAKARKADVHSNLGLIYSVVRRYRWALGASLEESDLVQAGALGLMKAAEKFDPSRGFQFSTYALWWVRQSVRRCIENERRVVRVPVHAQVSARKNGKPHPMALSLDVERFEGSGEAWVDTLPSAADTSEPAEEEESRRTVENAMAQLPDRLRGVLRKRFWDDCTLEDAGDGLGVTRERVRQMQNEALAKLRRNVGERP